MPSSTKLRSFSWRRPGSGGCHRCGRFWSAPRGTAARLNGVHRLRVEGEKRIAGKTEMPSTVPVEHRRDEAVVLPVSVPTRGSLRSAGAAVHRSVGNGIQTRSQPALYTADSQIKLKRLIPSH
jgi:hypothetical protein